MRDLYAAPPTRTAPPVALWSYERMDDQLQIQPGQLYALATRNGIASLQKAGFLPPLPAAKAELDWYLSSEHASFNRSLALIPTSHHGAMPEQEWLAHLTRLPSGGFHYDLVNDTGVLAVGVGGLITGLLHVERIDREGNEVLLRAQCLARLIPNPGRPPHRDLRPSGDDELDQWAAVHLGVRYSLVHGGISTVAI